MDLSQPHLADFFVSSTETQVNPPADSQPPEFFRIDTDRATESEASLRITESKLGEHSRSSFAERTMIWKRQKDERHQRAQQVKAMEEKAECQDAPIISDFAKRYIRRDANIPLPERLMEEALTKRAKLELLALKAEEDRLQSELGECTFYPDTKLTAVFNSQKESSRGRSKSNVFVQDGNHGLYRPFTNAVDDNMHRVKEYLKSGVFERLSNSHEAVFESADAQSTPQPRQSLDLDQFIQRQDEFEERRRLQLEREKFKTLCVDPSPKLSSVSRRLTQQSPDFFSRLKIFSEKKSVRLRTMMERLQPEEELTFRPKIMKDVPPIRSHNKHSIESVRQEIESEINRELTFCPNLTSSYPHNESRLKAILSDPEYSKKVHAQRLERERLAVENDRKRQSQELVGCTFKPSLDKSML